MANAVFEQFISEHLIKTNLVSGALLISKQGQPMYRYGDLKQLSHENITQFLGLFISAPATDSTAHKDLIISNLRGQDTKFKIYHKTYSSLYATSCENNGGLTVCNLPYGMLVCSYDSCTRPGEAVKAVERFCDILRR